MKSFKVDAEKLEADKAVIAVTITGHRAPPSKAADQVIRYNFVRETDSGRSTTSAAPATAKPGRSATC